MVEGARLAGFEPATGCLEGLIGLAATCCQPGQRVTAISASYRLRPSFPGRSGTDVARARALRHHD